MGSPSNAVPIADNRRLWENGGHFQYVVIALAVIGVAWFFCRRLANRSRSAANRDRAGT